MVAVPVNTYQRYLRGEFITPSLSTEVRKAMANSIRNQKIANRLHARWKKTLADPSFNRAAQQGMYTIFRKYHDRARNKFPRNVRYNIAFYPAVEIQNALRKMVAKRKARQANAKTVFELAAKVAQARLNARPMSVVPIGRNVILYPPGKEYINVASKYNK